MSKDKRRREITKEMLSEGGGVVFSSSLKECDAKEVSELCAKIAEIFKGYKMYTVIATVLTFLFVSMEASERSEQVPDH